MDPQLYRYAVSNVTLQQMALEQYWQFIKWSDTPESIIDVGIGDGRVTKNILLPRIPKSIKEYIGSDLSENMLNCSKEIIDHPKYDTIKMDICAEDIPVQYQNRFDKVFACLLLHMVSSKVKQALTNIYKLLKPGGQLIYTTFDKLPNDKAFHQLELTKWSKYRHHRTMSQFWNSKNPFEDYRKVTKDVGFQEDFVTLLDNQTIYFPNEQAYKNVAESVNMVLKDVLLEERNEYLEDYHRFLNNTVLAENSMTGEYSCEVNLVVVMATKY